MKTRLRSVAATTALLMLALAGGQLRVAGAVDQRFNSASDLTGWRFDFGGAAHTQSFDAAQDANGNAASGAMKITFGFNTALGGENKGAYTLDIFPGIDASVDHVFSMDVKVDPNSAVDAFGNNGFFQMVVRNTGNYDYNAQAGDNIRSADGWRHFSVSPLTGSANDVRALTFQLYGGPAQNINGDVTVWIDNLTLAPVPEPSTWALGGLGLLALLARRAVVMRALARKRFVRGTL